MVETDCSRHGPTGTGPQLPRRRAHSRMYTGGTSGLVRRCGDGAHHSGTLPCHWRPCELTVSPSHVTNRPPPALRRRPVVRVIPPCVALCVAFSSCPLACPTLPFPFPFPPTRAPPPALSFHLSYVTSRALLTPIQFDPVLRIPVWPAPHQLAPNYIALPCSNVQQSSVGLHTSGRALILCLYVLCVITFVMLVFLCLGFHWVSSGFIRIHWIAASVGCGG